MPGDQTGRRPDRTCPSLRLIEIVLLELPIDAELEQRARLLDGRPEIVEAARLNEVRRIRSPGHQRHAHVEIEIRRRRQLIAAQRRPHSGLVGVERQHDSLGEPP